MKKTVLAKDVWVKINKDGKIEFLLLDEYKTKAEYISSEKVTKNIKLPRLIQVGVVHSSEDGPQPAYREFSNIEVDGCTTELLVTPHELETFNITHLLESLKYPVSLSIDAMAVELQTEIKIEHLVKIEQGYNLAVEKNNQKEEGPTV